MNEITIAYVWSFRDKMASIPYRIDLVPGARSRKSCTCPAYNYSGKSTCKHIRILREKVKDGTIMSDDNYQITEFGKTFLKIQG